MTIRRLFLRSVSPSHRQSVEKGELVAGAIGIHQLGSFAIVELLEDVLEGDKGVFDVISIALEQKSLASRIEPTVDKVVILELLPAHVELVTSSR